MKRNFTHLEPNRAACSEKVHKHDNGKTFNTKKVFLHNIQKMVKSSLAEPSKESVEAILARLALV